MSLDSEMNTAHDSGGDDLVVLTTSYVQNELLENDVFSSRSNMGPVQPECNVYHWCSCIESTNYFFLAVKYVFLSNTMHSRSF